MRFCGDSSFLVRLYDPLRQEEEADAIREYLEDDQKVVAVSEPCRIEVLNVLLRRPESTAAKRFEDDLNEGLRLRLESVDWPDTFQRAESLARRFARILRPGGQDLVLVAAALAMGATWFLSYDRNSRQRPLAGAAGLRVWPPLDKDEKGLVRHATQKAGG
ncbi:MAG TPA: type II toxin-antitoxin system VapC family toxin [Verrucomicrobiota bacterium]|nr:type II toxin-antitoxin system VapC family toxin [Verrucomicrobiota bacterium]HNU52257.1 type II toxin-antitoxin system VapC family toxin [Verrucomicrobiota bacterium]